MTNLGVHTAEMLLVSIVGGMIALDRVALLQVMVSRPIVAAPLVGMLLGDMATGVKAGLILELLWIGSLPVGAYVPPDETVVSIVVTATALIGNAMLGGDRTELMVLSLCLTLPVSVIAARMDSFVRKRNIRSARAADACAGEGDLSGVGRACLKGIARFYSGYAVILFFFLAGNLAIISLIYPLLPPFVRTGFTAAAGLLPLVGFASLLSMMRVRNAAGLFAASFAGTFLVLRFFHGG